MNELSLIPAAKEFCENSNIVELKDGKVRYSGEWINYIKCLYYPEVSCIIQSCANLFDGINIKELDFSKYDFKNVIDFWYMFSWSKIEKIIGLNCSDKCIDLEGLCRWCHELREFDASRLNTMNVGNFTEMFRMCTTLQKLDLSNLDFSSVHNVRAMFRGAERLTELYIPSINRRPPEWKDIFGDTFKLSKDKLSGIWKEMYEASS